MSNSWRDKVDQTTPTETGTEQTTSTETSGNLATPTQAGNEDKEIKSIEDNIKSTKETTFEVCINVDLYLLILNHFL